MQQIILFLIKYKTDLVFILLLIFALNLTFQAHTYHNNTFISSANYITGNILETSERVHDYLDLKSQNENKLLLGPKYNNNHNLVFCKENGEKYYPSTVSRNFNKILQKTSLDPKLNIHSLRHTHATLLLKAKVNEYIIFHYYIGEILGTGHFTQMLFYTNSI